LEPWSCHDPFALTLLNPLWSSTTKWVDVLKSSNIIIITTNTGIYLISTSISDVLGLKNLERSHNLVNHTEFFHSFAVIHSQWWKKKKIYLKTIYLILLVSPTNIYWKSAKNSNFALFFISSQYLI
jgi:hypothetical protein